MMFWNPTRHPSRAGSAQTWWHNQGYSAAKAKKAISDSKKAVGHAEGLAELSVIYCVSCRDFLGFCSVDDEVFFRP